MFYLGQLIVEKRTKQKALFMGISPKENRAYLLVKYKKKVPYTEDGELKWKFNSEIFEIDIPSSELVRYEKARNKYGKIDPGTFSIKTSLFGKFTGFIRVENINKNLQKNIKKLVLETL